MQTWYPHGDRFPPCVAVPICGVTDELVRPQSQPYLVILIKEYMFPKHPHGPGLWLKFRPRPCPWDAEIPRQGDRQTANQHAWAGSFSTVHGCPPSAKNTWLSEQWDPPSGHHCTEDEVQISQSIFAAWLTYSVSIYCLLRARLCTRGWEHKTQKNSPCSQRVYLPHLCHEWTLRNYQCHETQRRWRTVPGETKARTRHNAWSPTGSWVKEKKTMKEYLWDNWGKLNMDSY